MVSTSSTDESWRPRLVALDIDGTLFKWVEGVGTTYEQISPAVYDAVHRALAAGAHVVLASGRSPHGMTNVADLLDLHPGDGERLWVVASNGAVVFRYPPLEVVHEETFDAAPAVAAVLEHHPSALVAVEERGVGYRVNRPFPTGELSGEFSIADVADLVAVPVSRVIIRDPEATADDFVALGRAPRSAGDRLRRRLDRLARPRTRRGQQGVRASSTSRASWASTRPTSSRSATGATTSRCSAGWAGAWPWASPWTR